MDIVTIGGGERLMECSTALTGHKSNTTDRVIILPIPTTRDKKSVSGTDIDLSEIYSYVLPSSLVAGYGIPEEICREIHTRGGVIYDAALDEGFLLENAQITAEGAVGTLLCSGKYRLRELRVGIIGYGRIGMALCRLLLFFGGNVRVFTGREEVIRALCEISVDAAAYSEMSLSDLDVLINTAPERLIPENADIPEGLKIIDLASGNYLEDIEGVIKMPSVPERMYPRSAGRLYAEYIKKHL